MLYWKQHLNTCTENYISIYSFKFLLLGTTGKGDLAQAGSFFIAPCLKIHFSYPNTQHRFR